jgi:predicted GTPase
MRAEPPIRIALIGLTGVGKSSTINALFNSGAPVSHTRACTKEADEYDADVKEYPAAEGRSIHVFDMPGLGEDIEVDESHIQKYSRVLPDVDVALWIMSAINRAIRPVQEFIRDYGHLTPNLVVGVNKVDLMPPGSDAWNKKLNLPSREQEQNIKGREEDIREKLGRWDWHGEVVAYSAERRYQLPELLQQMLRAASEKRRWVLEQSTEIAPFEDLVDNAVLQKARALAGV